MIASALLFLVSLQRPTTLTFIRHGETLANQTGEYNEETLNTFSLEGQVAVGKLTQRLVNGSRYTRILASPAPRVLKTIAPYLKATHQRATIWPLLYECCTGHRPHGAHATEFKWGSKIVIPREFQDLFVLIPGEDRYPVAPKYDEGLAQVDAAVAEFKRLYSGGDVLLVGHSGQGGHFLHELTGKWTKVDNAKEIVVKLP